MPSTEVLFAFTAAALLLNIKSGKGEDFRIALADFANRMNSDSGADCCIAFKILARPWSITRQFSKMHCERKMWQYRGIGPS